MREIKFRAWDKAEKEMFMPDTENNNEIFFAGFTNGVLRCSESQYDKGDDFILMQYTGLKDKNGKEIYEGDIVRISNHPFDGPIKVNRNYAVSYNSEMELCCGSWLLFRMRHYAEVIGNVFEHPELLEVNAS